MSKDSKVVEKVVENKDNGVADKAKEAIQTLKVQLVEHQKQAEYHTTMSVKAQGALEVLLQLHPQQEENNEN
tara:strand:+ start:163 stop:378 length:216 start_codon:yes stop_codon:yes gene_type:complete